MNRRERRAKATEERRAKPKKDEPRRSLPVVVDERTRAVRTLVHKAIMKATRGRESSELLPVLAAAAAGEAVRRPLDAKFAEEPRPACTKGCSFCCNVHVAVTIPELLFAAEFAKRALEPSALSALGARAKEAADAVRGKTPLTYPVQPCAFLAADGSCSVYAARPLACRGHHSFDVEACRLVYETNTDREISRKGSIVVLGDGAALGLRDALEELALDGGTYELNQALDVALGDPTAASRWRSGEPAFAAAKVVVSEEELRVMTKRTVVEG